MARLSVHIPTFIASASDVEKEKEAVQEIIEKFQNELKWNSLHLTSFHWKWDGRASILDSAQLFIDKYLNKSELAIVIFGNRLGTPISINNKETGMMHELRIASEKVIEGTGDDVLLYFKTGTTNEDLLKFKNELKEKSILFYEYSDLEEFEGVFSRHFRSWIDRWRLIPQITEFALKNSDREIDKTSFLAENKLINLRRSFNPDNNIEISEEIGTQVVTNYQAHGFKQSYLNGILKVDIKSFENFLTLDDDGYNKPLIKLSDDKYLFSHEEWFYYFCSVGLKNAILNNEIDKVAINPYLNPIHQYLSLQIKGSKQHIKTLINWLTNKNNITTGQPVVRNFAAYVLGMINAKEAEDDLAEAAQNDQGEDVRVYSIMSLGRLRSRKHLDLLLSLWSDPILSEELKLFISQSITNIIGITNYPH